MCGLRTATSRGRDRPGGDCRRPGDPPGSLGYGFVRSQALLLAYTAAVWETAFAAISIRVATARGFDT
jgi:hypothetical protein